MNRTIWLLMISDIFLITGFGLVAPILAIYIKENLVGGTIFAAGLASTLYLVTKCTIQLPFSRYVDSHDYKVRWLIAGTIVICFVPVTYMLAQNVYHMYLAQLLYGVGSGLSYPCWLGLWSTHLDKRQESFEWSLYSTLVGIGTALTGAVIAQFVGFKVTFGFVGLLAIAGCVVLLFLDSERKKLSRPSSTRHHKRQKLSPSH